jgi:hypothetical protein
MPMVSDELVQRVGDAVCTALAEAIDLDALERKADRDHVSRAAIAALSTPEFVLPLAEAMLKELGVDEVGMDCRYVALRGKANVIGGSLLAAYRAAEPSFREKFERQVIDGAVEILNANKCPLPDERMAWPEKDVAPLLATDEDSKITWQG